MKRQYLQILLLGIAFCKNPVYNAEDSLAVSNQYLQSQPRITTSFDEMNNDRNTRLITLGEAHVDPEKHVELNPFTKYDEDVEFVSDLALAKSEPLETFDDSMVRSKIAGIEQDIYDYYQFKSDQEKKDFLKDSPNAIHMFMEGILQLNSVLNDQESRIYGKIKDLKNELTKIYQLHKDSNLGTDLFVQAKDLTNLIDEKELQEVKLRNMDTHQFNMEKQIKQLDKPLQEYAERLRVQMLHGPHMEREFYQNLENFVYFAQRKSKLMKIYRRVAVIRVSTLERDLAAQQNAVLNLQLEWSDELQEAQKQLLPLMRFSNKLITGIGAKEMQIRKDVVKECLENLLMFPQIQYLCAGIQDTDDLHFDEVYSKFSQGIKSEFSAYEASIQSILTQMTFIRAIQDAVNRSDAPNAQQQLQRLTQEVLNNQKYIRANQDVNMFQIIVNEFRLAQVTQNLAIQNLDNILNAVMLDNFQNVQHAKNLENEEFYQQFQSNKASFFLATDKLLDVAGKLKSEYSSETSQEAEELLERVLQFRQKTVKHAKISNMINEKKYPEVRLALINEMTLLRNKEKTFEVFLEKVRNYFENVLTLPLESAQTQIAALENDNEVPAIVRLNLKMVQNYITIDERVKASQKLEKTIEQGELNLQGVVHSIQAVNTQQDIIDKIQKSTDSISLFKDLKKEITSYQEFVVFDPLIERLLKQIRSLLREKKSFEASELIFNLIEYQDSFEYRLSKLSEDVQDVYLQIQAQFQIKDYENMNYHGEELYKKLQIQEKETQLLYSIRRIMHLGITEDLENALKVAKTQLDSLNREYQALHGRINDFDKLSEQLQTAVENAGNHLDLTKLLSAVKNDELLSYRIYSSLEQSLSMSGTADIIGAKKALKSAISHINAEKTAHSDSANNVEQQVQFLQEFIDNKNKEIFIKVRKILDIYRHQSVVLFNQNLKTSFDKMWTAISNKDSLQAFKIMKEMSDTEEITMEKLWNKITHVADQLDDNMEDAINQISKLVERKNPQKEVFLQYQENQNQKKTVKHNRAKQLRAKQLDSKSNKILRK